jgi:3D (Asp-Asp-Asp) domain-containing protein
MRDRQYDHRVTFARIAALALAAAIGSAGAGSDARADTSKLAKEDVPLQPKTVLRGKNKLCCGYPLVEDEGWALRMYWLAFEHDYKDADSTSVPKTGRVALVPKATWATLYTPDGYYFGHVPERFAWSLRLEGTGIMEDGRLVNYTGPCKYGYGTCFEQLDTHEYPFGRGVELRPLVPFKSVAVDGRVIHPGEPLYIPEFDGMVLPDGSIHDGCVRADDAGGGIKGRKMDFFVVTYDNWRFLLEELLGVTQITPTVQSPRCEYMRDQ